MPDDIATYPPDAGATTYLLTVRGATNAPTLEEARALHNATAGAPQSAAGARALGDLSHNVFAPISKELDGQLLFIDRWNSLSGLGMFFANPQVQEAAGKLFSNSRRHRLVAPRRIRRIRPADARRSHDCCGRSHPGVGDVSR